MLVICDRKYIKILEKCVSENPLHRAEILSQWVKRSFSMTAMLNEKFINTVSVSDSEHPSSVFLEMYLIKKRISIIVKLHCSSTIVLLIV